MKKYTAYVQFGTGSCASLEEVDGDNRDDILRQLKEDYEPGGKILEIRENKPGMTYF